MSKFKFIFSQLWTLLQPVIKMLASSAGKVLTAAALDAVRVTMDTMGDADGEAKRKAAFDMILKDVTSKGKEVGTSAINMAIEIAVAKIKDSQN